MSTNVKSIDYVFVSCSHKRYDMNNETRYTLSNIAILATSSNFNILDVIKVDVNNQLNKDDVQKIQRLLSTCKYIIYWKDSDYKLIYEYFCNYFDNAVHVEFREVVNSVVDHEKPILDLIYTYIKIKNTSPSFEVNNSKNRNALLYMTYTDMYGQYYKLSDSVDYKLDTHNKIIHKNDCNIQDGHMQNGRLVELFRGYKLCENCFDAQDAKLIKTRKSNPRSDIKTKEEIQEDSFRKLQVTPKNIRLIGNYFDIPRIIMEGSCVTVETKQALWRFYMSSNDIVDKVYHCPKNNKNKKNRREYKFHIQDINKGTAFDTIRYIYHHDKDAKITRKTRVQKILEQISSEETQ